MYSFETNEHTPDPSVTKLPRVAVRDLLLDFLNPQPALISTGAQTFLFLDTPNESGFTVPLTSDYLRGWITVRHLQAGHPSPSDSQIRQAARVKEAQCLGGTTRNLRTRMNVRYAWNPRHRIPLTQTEANGRIVHDFDSASFEPAFVLSLDTLRGRHVAITRDRWTIHPGNAMFVYDANEEAIPDPVQPDTDTPAEADAALQPFRKLLRLDQSRHDDTWKSLLAWTLTAMRAPKDPGFHTFPILNLTGSGNSGKSVTARLLTRLLDPTLTPIHALPNTERRLHNLAANHHILAFDDPGKINPEKSRYLLRLASGVTSLHPKLQGTLNRPIILTTTEEKETQHLATRILDVELPPIEDPLSEEEILQQFEAMRQQILGALLTLLVGTFDAPPPFLPNRRTRNQKIEEAVTKFLATHEGPWTGTATDLIQALAAASTKTLVTQTLVCAEAMGRLLDQMRSIKITRLPRKNKERPIQLELRKSPVEAPHQPCPASITHAEPIQKGEPTANATADPAPELLSRDREGAVFCHGLLSAGH